MTPNRLLATASAAFLLLAVAACGEGSRSTDSVPTWRLREEWRVGGEVEGPHSFDANFGLAVLPGDSLIHFDFQNQQFHVLDAAGKPVRSFGRRGAGPGETDANGFAISPSGEIVVNDRGNNRLSRFDAAGTFLGAVAVPAEFTMGVRWNAEFLQDGRLLERYATATDSLGVGVWLDRTRLWSRDLSAFEELFLGSCMVSPRPAAGHTYIPTRKGADAFTGLLPLPFSGPWFATAVDPAGYLWGQPAPDSARLNKLPIGQCTHVATIALVDSAPSIPAAIADSALDAFDSFAAAGGGAPPAGTTLPTRFPIFWTLQVDDRHQLWVQRFGPNGEQRMEVYDSTGAILAHVNSFPLNPRWPIVFHGDRIYGLVADEDGIKHLVALSIVR